MENKLEVKYCLDIFMNAFNFPYVEWNVVSRYSTAIITRNSSQNPYTYTILLHLD
jgi:hypothetical protein